MRLLKLVPENTNIHFLKWQWPTTIVSVLLMIVLIGFLLIFAVAALVVVRCVLSLINAQKRQPMPNPGTWLA